MGHNKLVKAESHCPYLAPKKGSRFCLFLEALKAVFATCNPHSQPPPLRVLV